MLALRHERHLAVIVDEAEAHQPLVGHPLAELDQVEVAAIDAFV
jgi:hypothetical protein